ncbi:hypothetical protein [Flagellimonas eckloniae]|uniref:Uncharacterized protein n=1 Tax=Flagellimonas eckloniae TaxID=346185 RepID=A0A0Q1DRF7_9FLAO|nr:hypothetical protein [Allomuricauda eckloniae]KQC31431.1 hypothetical protein AAY42_17285 [Allomuricauda eckloniae]
MDSTRFSHLQFIGLTAKNAEDYYKRKYREWAIQVADRIYQNGELLNPKRTKLFKEVGGALFMGPAQVELKSDNVEVKELDFIEIEISRVQSVKVSKKYSVRKLKYEQFLEQKRNQLSQIFDLPAIEIALICSIEQIRVHKAVPQNEEKNSEAIRVSSKFGNIALSTLYREYRNVYPEERIYTKSLMRVHTPEILKTHLENVLEYLSEQGKKRASQYLSDLKVL